MNHDYSYYSLECAALLRQVSEYAMRRRYLDAAWTALKLASEAIRLARALRRVHDV